MKLFAATLLALSFSAFGNLTLNCVEFTVDADPRFEVSMEQASRMMEQVVPVSFEVNRSSLIVNGCQSLVNEQGNVPTPMVLDRQAQGDFCVYASEARVGSAFRYGWVCERTQE